MDNDEKIINAPSPWLLKGDGYIILYKFPKNFINKYPDNIPVTLKDLQLTTIGGVMLVNYTDSNVGPYHELLFIHGLFKYKNEIGFSISKIYVDSADSMVNGFNNWAIPKELADFNFSKKDNNITVNVSKNNHSVFNTNFSENNFSLPFNSKFIPLQLIQEKDNKIFLTKFEAKGSGGMIKINNLNSDGVLFPDINNLSPFITLRLNNFSMIFNKAREILI